MSDNSEKLFDMFPPVSTEEWKAKVVADLKGADFDRKLVWKTNEGFNVQPMYRAEDIASFKTTDTLPGEYPYVRGISKHNDWLTRQEIIAPSAGESNAVALEVLNKGVTSLGFKVNDAADVLLFSKALTLKKWKSTSAAAPAMLLRLPKLL